MPSSKSDNDWTTDFSDRYSLTQLKRFITDLKAAHPSLESINVGENLVVTFTAEVSGVGMDASVPVPVPFEALDEEHEAPEEEVPMVSYTKGSMPQAVQYDLDDWAKEKTAVQG